jgi:hypothetical protein
MPSFLMPKLNMPKTDVPSPPKFNVPALLSSLVPEFKVPDTAPKFDMPKVDVPLFLMPKFDIPNMPTFALTRWTCRYSKSPPCQNSTCPPHHPQRTTSRAKIQRADEVVLPGSNCCGREPGAAGGVQHLAYVCGRSGMQSKVIYGLNTSVVASFAQVNHIRF